MPTGGVQGSCGPSKKGSRSAAGKVVVATMKPRLRGRIRRTVETSLSRGYEVVFITHTDPVPIRGDLSHPSLGYLTPSYYAVELAPAGWAELCTEYQTRWKDIPELAALDEARF